MANPTAITINHEGDDTKTYAETWVFLNPNEAKVKCSVIKGKGEISLYKNDVWIGQTYTLSKGPTDPDTIYMNTNTTSTNKKNPSKLTIEEGDTLRSIALRYGVKEKDITYEDGNEINNLQPGDVVKIPPSKWALYLVALNHGSNEFEVELVAPEEE